MDVSETEAHVVNLYDAWDLAMQAGLDGCFDSSMTSFNGWEPYFDDYATSLAGRRKGGVVLKVQRRSTGETERWMAFMERLTPDWDTRPPIPYEIRRFERIE